MMKKKLKIALLSFYSGSNNRGVESFVFEVASRLAQNNEVVVYQEGPVSKTVFKTIRKQMNINWKRKDMSETVWRKLFVDYWSVKIGLQSLKLFPTIVKNKYDIVVPLNGGWQSALMRIATWLYGGKMIISGQSGLGWDDRNNLWTFPNSFIALTSYQKKWAKKVNPIVRIDVIHNGADVARFSKQTEGWNINLEHPIFLDVSALSNWKRIDLAIKAVSKLKSGSLLVVGNGNMKKELDVLGNKLLPNRFKIISLPYSKMESAYHGVDVFTFPTSPSESFGIVLVEAMAANLPVVATDDPIRREIVGDAGLFVDPTNADTYAKTLEKALKIKWGDRPRKQAQKYSWDAIAKDYENLFYDLIGADKK